MSTFLDANSTLKYLLSRFIHYQFLLAIIQSSFPYKIYSNRLALEFPRSFPYSFIVLAAGKTHFHHGTWDFSARLVSNPTPLKESRLFNPEQNPVPFIRRVSRLDTLDKIRLWLYSWNISACHAAWPFQTESTCQWRPVPYWGCHWESVSYFSRHI